MKDKLYSVYCHLNKINGKRYIGITFRPVLKRWKNGKGYNEVHQPIFAAAIKKYGWNNFEHIIIEENIIGHELACEKEKYWISYYHTWIKDPLCAGYNMTPGGDFCNFAGKHHTEEAKIKIAAAAKTSRKHKYTEEERHAISLRNTGYRHTEEAKQKIGLASAGHTLSTEAKLKISAKKKGVKLSDDHKLALHKKHNSSWKTIKIYCIELDIIFDNIDDAHEKTNINKDNIRKVCRGERITAGGYHWEYYKKEN